MRKIHENKYAQRMYRVFSKPETKEFVVKFYENNIENKAAQYFAVDKEDAIGTGDAFLLELAGKNRKLAQNVVLNVTTNTLSDGSKTYDLIITKELDHIRIACTSQNDARVMAHLIKKGIEDYTLETVEY